MANIGHLSSEHQAASVSTMQESGGYGETSHGKEVFTMAFSPELACWSCEKAQETGTHQWANHAICLGEFNDHRLGLWAVTIWGWLHLLAEMLGLAIVNELLEKSCQGEITSVLLGKQCIPYQENADIMARKGQGHPGRGYHTDST